MLKVENLSIRFKDDLSDEDAVKGISFAVQTGEIAAIVGESGSGKSMTALSIMGLLKKHAEVQGSIFLDDMDLLALDKKQRHACMGDEIAMIFQEPMTSLNPVMRVGKQVDEILRLHPDSMEKGKRSTADRKGGYWKHLETWIYRIRKKYIINIPMSYPEECGREL